MNKAYYRPNEVTFLRDTITWLLEHRVLQHWPKDPTDSSLDGMNEIQRTRRNMENDPAWKTVQLEVSMRLGLCGRDGALVILFYSYGAEIEDIAKASGIDQRQTSNRISNALNYISWGSGKKENARTPRGTYLEWCQRKKREIVKW